MKTGFYNDDALNSLIYADLHLVGVSVFEFALKFIKIWLKDSGRFVAVSFFTAFYLWTYVFKTLLVYKALMFAAVLSNIGLFSVFLRSINVRSQLVRFSLIILPLLFQMRNYHDPISSYGLILQVVLMGGLIPSILLQRFAQTQKRRYLIGGWFVYLFSVLLYELSLIWILLFVVVSYFQLTSKPISKKNLISGLWKSLSGFIVGTLGYVIFIVVVRLTHSHAYTGTQFSWGTGILKTLIFQISGAFPFTYIFSDAARHFPFFPYNVPKTSILEGIKCLEGWPCRSVLLLLVSSFLFFFTLRDKSFKKQLTGSRNRFWFFGLLSLIFTVAPAAMIALSKKYQSEVIMIGLSYLPVYLSYFGVALGGALILEQTLLKRKVRLNQFASVIVALLFGVAITANTSINEVQAEHLNSIWKYPRDLYLESLKLGLMDEIPEGSTIFHKPRERSDFPWVNRAVTYYEIGKKLEFKNLEKIDHADLQHSKESQSKYYYVEWFAHTSSTGWVILSHLSGSSSPGRMVIFIYSDKAPGSLFLEDQLGHTVSLDRKVQPLKRKNWFSAEVSSEVLDKPSTKLRGL
jgi:hypothetical protein